MIVVSRDGEWLSRLERLALRGGWPFETYAALPSSGRASSRERVLAVLDRALAGSAPKKTVEDLRKIFPGAAIVLALGASELDHDGVSAAVFCGADEVLSKSWPDGKLSLRLAALRDRSLAARARLSADGALKAERRSHRAHIKLRGRWKELALDAGGFAILWRLLEREGEPVSRAELGETLSAAAGRELEVGTVIRRVAALKKALASWPGSIESARGGFYSLTSASRRRSTT